MTSLETVPHKKVGFDSDKYFQLQKEEILKRTDKFSNGRLYLEIGGKLLWDPHGARVLPGFDPKVKVELFKELSSEAELLFCVDAKDMDEDRQLYSEHKPYLEATYELIQSFEEEMGLKAKIVINKITGKEGRLFDKFIEYYTNIGYEVYKRYFIKGYPDDTKHVLSEEGYGKDDYIPVKKKLILVTGAASGSGKMSTCLGQVYQETKDGLNSGYAKYETFPIWNLPLEHPINLAYEAATADIGDYNVDDIYHRDHYGINSVNYNRDVDAFVLLKKLSEQFLPKDNHIRSYKSPTDMGINMAGYAITDDKVCAISATEEITRRKGWYQEQVERGEGEKIWVTRCEKLEEQAKRFLKPNQEA